MSVNIPWERSVERARAGNQRAIEGRFEIALASLEQIDFYGTGTSNGGGRTLLTFAEEAGIEYGTLSAYRQIVGWWYDGDPLTLVADIPVPDNMSWHALRWAKAHIGLAADLRLRLQTAVPANGRTFTQPDIEVLYREDRTHERAIDARGSYAGPLTPVAGSSRLRQRSSNYEAAIFGIVKMHTRAENLLAKIRDERLDDDQRGKLRDAAEATIRQLEELRDFVAEAESAAAV